MTSVKSTVNSDTFSKC